MKQLNLFGRPPVSLAGYIPKFSKTDCLLGYREESLHYGFKLADPDDRDELESESLISHSIFVQGIRLYGHSQPYYENAHANAIAIAKEFIASGPSKSSSHYLFLVKNIEALENSARYWMTVDKLAAIENDKSYIQGLLELVNEKEKLVAIDMIGVLEERKISASERQKMVDEFGL